jgi:hypothetical protein
LKARFYINKPEIYFLKCSDISSGKEKAVGPSMPLLGSSASLGTATSLLL